MTSAIEEDFELELRSLPGVVNVGLTRGEGGTVTSVALTIRNHDPQAVRESALQVASLYFPEAEVVLEEATAGPAAKMTGMSRVALIAAEFNHHDGMSEVHLRYGGRTGVGRAGSGPLVGGAEATLSALRDLGYVIPFYLMGVSTVETVIGCSVIVSLRSLSSDDDRMGIARADDNLVSAAKATLDALNRYVSMDAERRQQVGAGAVDVVPASGLRAHSLEDRRDFE